MSQFLWRFLVIGTLVSGLSACAVVPPNTGENPSDPWETMNRQTYAFNMKVDTSPSSELPRVRSDAGSK